MWCNSSDEVLRENQRGYAGASRQPCDLYGEMSEIHLYKRLSEYYLRYSRGVIPVNVRNCLEK